MPNLGFSKMSFDLLEALEVNNNKEWMEENRKAVKTHLQEPFAFLLDCLTRELSDHDLPMMGSKKTMFRLNRDIRFSKDKRPYNHHVSGLLTPSGTKSETDAVLYLRLENGNSFMGAGYYGLSAKQLGPKRDKFLEQPERFASILADLKANDLALSTENSLSNMPRGYTQYKDHELAHYLRLKSFIVRKTINKTDWYTSDLVKSVAEFKMSTASVVSFFRHV